MLAVGDCIATFFGVRVIPSGLTEAFEQRYFLDYSANQAPSPHRAAPCAASRAAGFVAMIEKPIRPRTLVATLADILMLGDSPDAWARAG